jgi:hypothetical protein
MKAYLHHDNYTSSELWNAAISIYRKSYMSLSLAEDKNGLALVDTGFGVTEVRNPVKYIGQELIDAFVIEF